MRPSLFYLILLLLLLTSCNFYKKKNTVSDKSIQIASIDSIPINYDEVDNLCRQELFDQLSRIHLIRKVTLEQVIKDKVLQLEANKLNITVEQLTNSLYKNKITSANLVKFASLTNNTERVNELRETLISHDVKSPKGQEILAARYKQYLMKHFLDSLKKTHQIAISLKPPKSPTIKMDNLVAHYKGNLNSAVTFMVISDFDCHMCRESNTFFEKLYSEYKGKVRFGFTHYSSYVSNSAIASECASNQGKFWEMHDSIFKPKMIPDSVALFRMAKNLKLDMARFATDYRNKDLSENIKANLYKLESAGVYGTPTIMINNQLIFNSTSLNEIEKMLKEEIRKVE
jgi:protein-disulfide isomerase